MTKNGSAHSDFPTPIPLPANPHDTFRSRRFMRSPGSSGEITLELIQWHLDHEGAQRAAEVDDDPASSDLNIDPSRAAGFQLLRRVNGGGSGEIWEAVQKSLGRIVAVKTMRESSDVTPLPSTNASQEDSVNFKREALTTASLEHPNIVPIYDLGLDERGRPLLAMKMIRGKPWSEIMRDEFEALPPVEFLARHIPTLIDVAQAIAFAHSRGIAHRDIKPAQVMVGEFGETLVTDWGLAVVFDRRRLESSTEGSSAARFTPSVHNAPSPAGTPACMAPEQTLRTAEGVGPWTDIYLLGASLYYLLTGTYPHDSDSSGEAFRRAQLGFVEPPEKRAETRPVPPLLSRLCMRCMEVEVRDRLRDVNDIIITLQNYLTGASKRSESRELTENVSACFENSPHDYESLNTCSNMLNRATNLWPENPQLSSLRELIYREYAREALANNDLTLARMQAASIPNDEIRRTLMADIEKAHEDHRRESRVRRQLTVILALLVVILSIFGYRLNDVSQQNEQEVSRRLVDQHLTANISDRVQQQKEIAENLRHMQRLQAEEQDLAGEIRHDLPLSENLITNHYAGSTFEVPRYLGAQLMRRAHSLRREREQLRQRLGEEDRKLLTPPPIELSLVEPLYQLYSAQSRNDLSRAHEAFASLYYTQSGVPEFSYGLGLAAARLGDFSAAQEYFERAALLANASRGTRSEIARNAEALAADAENRLYAFR